MGRQLRLIRDTKRTRVVSEDKVRVSSVPASSYLVAREDPGYIGARDLIVSQQVPRPVISRTPDDLFSRPGPRATIVTNRTPPAFIERDPPLTRVVPFVLDRPMRPGVPCSDHGVSGTQFRSLEDRPLRTGARREHEQHSNGRTEVRILSSAPLLVAAAIAPLSESTARGARDVVARRAANRSRAKCKSPRADGE